MTTHIGLATSTDVAEVHALDQACFGVDAWSEESVRRELTGANRVALVARDDGALTGYAITALNGDVLDLQRIAVASDRRRTGLARSLFEVLLAEGSRSGAQRMMLEVSLTNESGRAFYRDCGLVEVARRPGYYRDGTDAVVMEMPLGARNDQDGETSGHLHVDLGEEWRRDA